jgi:hypothetical protein
MEQNKEIFFFSPASDLLDMENLALHGSLKIALGMEEKIKWEETKTSEKEHKKEKTEDQDLWIYLYTGTQWRQSF